MNLQAAKFALHRHCSTPELIRRLGDNVNELERWSVAKTEAEKAAQFEMQPSQSVTRIVRSGQLSLIEMFFATSMSALALALYPFVNAAIVFAMLAILVYALAMSRIRTTNPIVGGLIGFAIAGVLAIVVGLIASLGTLYAPFAITAPGAGFVIGATRASLEGV